MKSNWLDGTLHLSTEELRVLEWMEAVTLGGDELPELTNSGECAIIGDKNENN